MQVFGRDNQVGKDTAVRESVTFTMMCKACYAGGIDLQASKSISKGGLQIQSRYFVILLEQACYTSSEQQQNKTGRQTCKQTNVKKKKKAELRITSMFSTQALVSSYTIRKHKESKTKNSHCEQLSLCIFTFSCSLLFASCRESARDFSEKQVLAWCLPQCRVRHWLLRLVSTAANMWSPSVKKLKLFHLAKLWLLPK